MPGPIEQLRVRNTDAARPHFLGHDGEGLLTRLGARLLGPIALRGKGSWPDRTCVFVAEWHEYILGEYWAP